MSLFKFGREMKVILVWNDMMTESLFLQVLVLNLLILFMDLKKPEM